MGGDHAPQMVIDGMNRAMDRLKNVRFLLFGRSDEVAPLVERFRRLRQRVEVRHASDVVGGSERPSTALRAGRNSSMRHAIDAVAAGDADGVVSAGNTGALMAMAKFVFKTLPGVDRPAIASVFPTLRGRTVLLDLGANVNCSADNLVQFAVMGEVFARNVLRPAEPVRRPAQRRRGGSEGQRRGEEGGGDPAAEQARHPLPRLRRRRRHRHGHGRRRRHRRLHRQHRAEDGGRDGAALHALTSSGR